MITKLVKLLLIWIVVMYSLNSQLVRDKHLIGLQGSGKFLLDGSMWEIDTNLTGLKSQYSYDFRAGLWYNFKFNNSIGINLGATFGINEKIFEPQTKTVSYRDSLSGEIKEAMLNRSFNFKSSGFEGSLGFSFFPSSSFFFGVDGLFGFNIKNTSLLKLSSDSPDLVFGENLSNPYFYTPTNIPTYLLGGKLKFGFVINLTNTIVLIPAFEAGVLSSFGEKGIKLRSYGGGTSLTFGFGFHQDCPPGFELVRGECLPECKGKQIRNPQGDCECPPTMVFNERIQDCECPPKQVYNRSKGICECVGGMIVNTQGDCECPKGTYWSISRQKCLTIDTNFFSYELDKPTNQYVVDYVEYVKKIHYNIINSIFFDEDDVNISDRYMVLRKEEVNKFSENNFDEEALDVDLYGELENVQNVTRLAYYNVLNILGYRLSSNPSYKLHLIGYYPYESKNNADSLIPSTRIKAIKNYLEKIWNVSNQITYEIRKELNIEGETQLNSSYKERKSLRDRVDFEILNAESDVYFVTKTVSISQTSDELIINWNKNNELAPRKFNLLIYAKDQIVFEATQNNFSGDKINIKLSNLGLVYNRFVDSFTVIIKPDTLDNIRSKQVIRLDIPVKYNISESRRKYNSPYDTTKYQIFFTNYLFPDFIGILDISKFGLAKTLLDNISFNPMYHHINFAVKLPSALSTFGTKSKMSVVLSKALVRHFIYNLKMNESDRFFSINSEKSLSNLYKKVELPEFKLFDSRAIITIYTR